MDYDSTDIALAYDEARAVVPETRHQWRELLAAHIDPAEVSLIVDVGCGTGRFSKLLAGHFGAKVVAIDPSQKMLEQARVKLTRGGVALLRGSADSLPLRDGSADLAFMSMVYHHLADPVLAAKECHRILRRGGYACVRNTTHESDFPHRHFFPGIQALIDTQLPTGDDIVASFTAEGFAPVVRQLVTQVTATDWVSFVHKSALRADSFLARLSDENFGAGMARLHAHSPEIGADRPVTEEVGWFVFKKRG